MSVETSASSVIERIEQEYRRRTQRSGETFESGMAYVPGGASRSLVVFGPYPLVMTQGQGSHFSDLDGNDYVDFVNCNSALVHGHAHPGITEAIKTQAERGTAWSSASEEEIALAKLLCDRVASVEKIRFCSSGTEAGMYVPRMARAYTGKDKILKFEGGYHGSYDDVEMSKTINVAEAGPLDDPQPVAATIGFPRGTADRVLIAPFNNREVTTRRIEENKDDLAAVIVEPMIGAGGMIAPEEGFLTFLREITSAYGIVLIADEVVSFRLAYGGAQELYGFKPDLTMFGKVIGGGLPVAAIGGREDIMQLTSYNLGGTTPGKLSLSGTFSGAAIGMAAGKASLEALDSEAIQRINELGEFMQQGIREALREAGITAQVTGVGSLLQLHFNVQPVTEHRGVITAHRNITSALHLWLMNKGIAGYARGAFNISTPMTQAEVSRAVEAIMEGLWELKPYIQSVAPELVNN